MGMGWNLLRRKALTALGLALVLACTTGWAESAETVPVAAPEPAPEDGGPLPPAQGHVGAELYSFTFPDEDVIDRFVEGLRAGRGDWLQAVLDRSLRYRALIDRAIAERGLPPELRDAVIHRLEIPLGRFERRVPLPPGRYEAARRYAVHGCLLVTLRKLI